MRADKLMPAGWIMILILTVCLLLAFFGNGEVVSSQMKESSMLKEAVLGGPVNPGGVTGQSLWVKADVGLLVNGSDHVQEWLDQSGSGNTTTELRASLPAHTNAIAPSADILRVPNGINFNPAIDFSGALGKSLKGDAATQWDASPVSIFSVALPEGAMGGGFGAVWTSHAHWTVGGPGTAGLGIFASGTASYSLDGNGCSTAATTSAITEPRVIRAIYTNPATNLGGSTWLNGVQEATGTSCGAIATTFFEVGGRTAGASTWDVRVFNGKITEVVVHKSVLPAAEANRIESYLAVKYGITLRQTPAAQNYTASDGTTAFWDSSVNTIYNKNIAGIGRDDASGLNQKQSRSVNLPASGNMVTIGLNTIAADNASNTNSFGADRDFLTWGDDGAGAGFTTLITPPLGILATVRLTRIWKVQETGTIPTVKVGIPANLGGGNIVYLVVSGDTTFDASDQYFPMTPLTAGSTTYQAADFDFTTGQFFTFATLPAIPGGVAAPAAWQKANDGAPTGSLWDDSSAGNNDASQVTPASQPAFVPGSDAVAVNFNPTFDFDGANDFLAYTNTLGVQGLNDFSSLVVLKQDTANLGVYFGNAGLDGNFTAHIAASGAYGAGISGNATGTCAMTSTTTLPLGVPGIGSYVRASSTITGQLNGGGTSAGVCNQSFAAASRLLGRRIQAAVNSFFFNGQMPEFIHYDRALTLNEVQRLQSYLAIKYGITLDQTAPTSYLASDSAVIWDSAMNAVYNDDITGIGRDDVSALNQKQSASVNAGNFVTIGLGPLAPDNESNSNSFPANKDFLIWGHDAGTTAFNVQVVGSANVRMARIWKVQETAGIPPAPAPEAVTNVVVRVPQSLFTNPFPVLARSNDSTFEATDEFIPMTANGTDYEATIDFSNGDFFTFAQLVTPTAANVSISGRVLTADGRGIRSTVVVLADSEGNSRTATTSSFGYYRFDDVPAGGTYVLSVSSKRYQFEPRVVNVQDEIANLDFIAQE
jgi:hypothetical protein